jgi:hypothetical protein
MTGQLPDQKALRKAPREFEKARHILEDVLDRATLGEAGEKEVLAALLAVIEAGDRMERARQRSMN